MSEQIIDNQLVESFTKVLNRNGYGFQYSVLKEIHRLAKLRKSPYLFEVSEFPVKVQGVDTKIDFILRHTYQSFGNFRTMFLVAECKRVNPAYSNWLFLKSPFLTNTEFNQDKFLIQEALVKEGDQYSNYSVLKKNEDTGELVKRGRWIDSNYHLGLDVKTNKKGDTGGEMGDAIEKAASQVLRGLNGLKQSIINNPKVWDNEKEVDFLPVIFTTADLFVSEVDISLSDLTTGKIDLTTDDIHQVNWLYYQYPMSLGLTHANLRNTEEKELANLLYSDHIRTIAIVSAKGIEDFFTRDR